MVCPPKGCERIFRSSRFRLSGRMWYPRKMRRRDWLALCAAPLAAAEPAVHFAPAKPFPGAPILFTAPVAGPATWLGRNVQFQKDPETSHYVALAGVGLKEKPGVHELRTESGAVVPVRVLPRAYRTSVLKVAPKFVSPPKTVQKRLDEEQALKRQVFAERGERRWSGVFAPPTRTTQTAPFGSRRTYNGKMQSIHQGLDFRAAIGTPILAANHGRVVIARNMYYEGGFVALDHGEGIFTLYMHLSAFRVKEGATVERGQELALSGDSGRVTGPHLHFGVQWQGVYLEPATLLALSA